MKEWFGSFICNKAASDAKATESITEKAQAILFQSSMDIAELL